MTGNEAAVAQRVILQVQRALTGIPLPLRMKILYFVVDGLHKAFADTAEMRKSEERCRIR